MSRISRARCRVGVAIGSTLLAAGCGGDAGEDASSRTPQETIEAVYSAGAAGDWEGVCDLLTPEVAEASIEIQQVETCAEAQEAGTGEAPDDLFARLEFGETTEDGEAATVEVSFEGETEQVSLRMVGDEWRLDE